MSFCKCMYMYMYMCVFVCVCICVCNMYLCICSCVCIICDLYIIDRVLFYFICIVRYIHSMYCDILVLLLAS